VVVEEVVVGEVVEVVAVAAVKPAVEVHDCKGMGGTVD